jgi:hypothetical protein
MVQGGVAARGAARWSWRAGPRLGGQPPAAGTMCPQLPLPPLAIGQQQGPGATGLCVACMWAAGCNGPGRGPCGEGGRGAPVRAACALVARGMAKYPKAQRRPLEPQTLPDLQKSINIIFAAIRRAYPPHANGRSTQRGCARGGIRNRIKEAENTLDSSSQLTRPRGASVHRSTACSRPHYRVGWGTTQPRTRREYQGT